MTAMPQTKLVLKAPAKVNLTLEAVARRDDGYHEIVSIIQTVNLYDTLALESANDITLECDVAALQSSDNLALKAAHLLRETADCDKGVRIALQKRIPVAAGLGGGSSDAAAVLRGLDRLWGLGMSNARLASLAAQLGSDVPFFLYGGTAMIYGRGERVRPLPPADLEWMVILTPDIDVDQKTASSYGKLTRADFTTGALTRKLEARIRGGGDVPPQFLFNVFDDIAFDTFPGMEKYWNTFHSLGAREIHVAGSGPSMFAPVSRRELGTAIHLLFERTHGWRSHLVSTWQPDGADDA